MEVFPQCRCSDMFLLALAVFFPSFPFIVMKGSQLWCILYWVLKESQRDSGQAGVTLITEKSLKKQQDSQHRMFAERLFIKTHDSDK